MNDIRGHRGFMQGELRPKAIRILDERLEQLFGQPSDGMPEIDARAGRLYPGQRVVVWEGDPATFQFTFVGRSALTLLGYPLERWTREATFWADHVVHKDDREEAINYCALATAKGRDHEFEYRAVAADGRLVWLRDVVRVIVGGKGIAVLLRGAMFDVTEEKRALGGRPAPQAPRPSKTELLSA